MAEETLPRTQAVFDGIMNVAGVIFTILFWIAFALAGIALGYLAWEMLDVQKDQVPWGSWGDLYFPLGAATLFGVVIGFTVIFDSDIPDNGRGPAWCVGHLVMACIMWFFLGICLLNVERTIKVPEGRFMVSTEGKTYFPGERAPRGYLRVASLPATASKTFTVDFVSSQPVTGSAHEVRITRTVTFEASVRDHPDLERMLQNLARQGISDFDPYIWQYTDLFIESFKEKIQAVPNVTTGSTFRAPRPWMNRIRVVKVAEDADLVPTRAQNVPAG